MRLTITIPLEVEVEVTGEWHEGCRPGARSYSQGGDPGEEPWFEVDGWDHHGPHVFRDMFKCHAQTVNDWLAEIDAEIQAAAREAAGGTM